MSSQPVFNNGVQVGYGIGNGIITVDVAVNAPANFTDQEVADIHDFFETLLTTKFGSSSGSSATRYGSESVPV